MSVKDTIYFNGIDAVTGNYLIEPSHYSAIASPIRSKLNSSDESELEGLGLSANRWLRRVRRNLTEPHLGWPFDMDPTDVKQAGWGIIFHENESDDVRKAFEPLIKHRHNQIANDHIVKVFDYETGEDRASWLARHGVGAGSPDPAKVPYYLLIVGGPTQIPFSFCHELDVEYGVGVLHFDLVSEYETYIQSVIAYEIGASVRNKKEVVFFASRHDPATELSSKHLVNPLAQKNGVVEKAGFRSRRMAGAKATKAALARVLAGKTAGGPPALLFTASHGLGFPEGHPSQESEQGALLCQGWPGSGPPSSNHCFAAQDLTDDSSVHGMITFSFACFSAGTPEFDRFIHEPGEPPERLASNPFLSRLSKRLLSHPAGSALAFIGHVERAWGYSIIGPGDTPQLVPFRNTIGLLLRGKPLGYAMKDFNEKYAMVATSLSSMLEQISFGAFVSDERLASTWIERNDAEGYILIGDPAIQLRVADIL